MEQLLCEEDDDDAPFSLASRQAMRTPPRPRKQKTATTGGGALQESPRLSPAKRARHAAADISGDDESPICSGNRRLDSPEKWRSSNKTLLTSTAAQRTTLNGECDTGSASPTTPLNQVKTHQREPEQEFEAALGEPRTPPFIDQRNEPYGSTSSAQQTPYKDRRLPHHVSASDLKCYSSSLANNNQNYQMSSPPSSLFSTPRPNRPPRAASAMVLTTARSFLQDNDSNDDDDENNGELEEDGDPRTPAPRGGGGGVIATSMHDSSGSLSTSRNEDEGTTGTGELRGGGAPRTPTQAPAQGQRRTMSTPMTPTKNRRHRPPSSNPSAFSSGSYLETPNNGSLSIGGGSPSPGSFAKDHRMSYSHLSGQQQMQQQHHVGGGRAIGQYGYNHNSSATGLSSYVRSNLSSLRPSPLPQGGGQHPLSCSTASSLNNGRGRESGYARLAESNLSFHTTNNVQENGTTLEDKFSGPSSRTLYYANPQRSGQHETPSSAAESEGSSQRMNGYSSGNCGGGGGRRHQYTTTMASSLHSHSSLLSPPPEQHQQQQQHTSMTARSSFASTKSTPNHHPSTQYHSPESSDASPPITSRDALRSRNAPPAGTTLSAHSPPDTGGIGSGGPTMTDAITSQTPSKNGVNRQLFTSPPPPPLPPLATAASATPMRNPFSPFRASNLDNFSRVHSARSNTTGQGQGQGTTTSNNSQHYHHQGAQLSSQLAVLVFEQTVSPQTTCPNTPQHRHSVSLTTRPASRWSSVDTSQQPRHAPILLPDNREDYSAVPAVGNPLTLSGREGHHADPATCLFGCPEDSADVTCNGVVNGGNRAVYQTSSDYCYDELQGGGGAAAGVGSVSLHDTSLASVQSDDPIAVPLSTSVQTSIPQNRAMPPEAEANNNTQEYIMEEEVDESDPFKVSGFKYEHRLPWKKEEVPIRMHEDFNGSVWLVTSLVDGLPYALKHVPKNGLKSNSASTASAELESEEHLHVPAGKQKKQHVPLQAGPGWRRLENKQKSPAHLRSEIEALSLSAKCPFIIRYHGSYLDADTGCYILQTEYCTQGTLTEYALNYRDDYGIPCLPPEREVRRIMEHVYQGLAFLHSNHICHGNLHPVNCFVDSNSMVKIGNFGASRKLKTDHDRSRSLLPLLYDPPAEYTGETPFSRDVYSFAAGLLHLLWRCILARSGEDSSYELSKNFSLSTVIQASQGVYSDGMAAVFEGLLSERNERPLAQGVIEFLQPCSRVQLEILTAYQRQVYHLRKEIELVLQEEEEQQQLMSASSHSCTSGTIEDSPSRRSNTAANEVETGGSGGYNAELPLGSPGAGNANRFSVTRSPWRDTYIHRTLAATTTTQGGGMATGMTMRSAGSIDALEDSMQGLCVNTMPSPYPSCTPPPPSAGKVNSTAAGDLKNVSPQLPPHMKASGTNTYTTAVSTGGFNNVKQDQEGTLTIGATSTCTQPSAGGPHGATYSPLMPATFATAPQLKTINFMSSCCSSPLTSNNTGNCVAGSIGMMDGGRQTPQSPFTIREAREYQRLADHIVSSIVKNANFLQQQQQQHFGGGFDAIQQTQMSPKDSLMAAAAMMNSGSTPLPGAAVMMTETSASAASSSSTSISLSNVPDEAFMLLRQKVHDLERSHAPLVGM